MGPGLAALLAVLAVTSAQEGGERGDWEPEPCLGCEEEAQEAAVVKRSVPISLVAAGMLSRRSALDNNFMRFGRSVPPARAREPRTDNFVRFGRSLVNDEFDRTVRGDPKGNNNGFLRFGRAKDNYMRFGRTKDNYMRFGRAPADSEEDEEEDAVSRESFGSRFGRSVSGGGSNSNFVRFGRAAAGAAAEQTNTTDVAEKRAAHKTENLMRFGRAKDNYMRFGRGKDDYVMRFGRAKDNYMRFGRGKDNYMRFGRKDDFMRFGRKDDFMRFGRKDDFMRFGRKDDFMRFGRSGDAEDDNSERHRVDA